MGNSLSKINFMENAMIYKISCKDELIKDYYIGSTFDFDVRYKQHKTDYKNVNSHCYNYKIYQFIRNNGGFDNFKFDILLSFECENTKQKVIKEQEYLDEFKPSLNDRKAFRTEEERIEYNEKHYENNKEYYKEYNEKHKAKFTEKFNCECGGKYQFKHKSTHKKSKRHKKFLES